MATTHFDEEGKECGHISEDNHKQADEGYNLPVIVFVSIITTILTIWLCTGLLKW